MRKKIYKSVSILFVIQFFVFATVMVQGQQGRTGIGTVSPNSTLDVRASTTNTQEITGFTPPRLTLAELTAKGNTLYGAAQNGTLVYIKDVTGGDVLSQRQLINQIGYYYFDAPNNLWQRMSQLLPTNNDGWTNLGTFQSVATNYVDINTTANTLTAADIPGMVLDIPIPAGKEAKIIATYSTPLGAFFNSSNRSGYYGTRVLRNNVKLPYASKKASLVFPNNSATYGMKTITQAFVDVIPASPTAQTYTYKLQAFNQNGSDFTLRAGMYVPTGQNYNWGRGSWVFSVYIR